MYLGQSLTDVLEHLQHLHHVQVAVAVVVLSIVIIVVEFGNNTSPPPDKTCHHLADTEEVAACEPDGDNRHNEEVEHAEDGDDEDIPGHVDATLYPTQKLSSPM